MCARCVAELGLNLQDFQFQWEEFDAQGLIGKRVTFGKKQPSALEHGLFGIDMDPTTEAIVIAILSSILYDALKCTAGSLRERITALLKDPSNLEKWKDQIGELSEDLYHVVEKVIDWVRERVDSFDRWLNDKGHS